MKGDFKALILRTWSWSSTAARLFWSLDMRRRHVPRGLGALSAAEAALVGRSTRLGPRNVANNPSNELGHEWKQAHVSLSSDFRSDLI